MAEAFPPDAAGSGVPQRKLPNADPSKAGTISSLSCKCSDSDDRDFLVKRDCIVCANCGREVSCTPPIKGVVKAACECCTSPTVKATFVLDSTETYVCTWCGRTR